MADAPNIVLLIFDTLRADYLSTYGSRVRTPNFDSVGENGVCFEHAFAAGPGTPVSHASMYTGRYPSETGVTGPYIDLPDDEPVLAAWFNDRGYETFGITGPSKMGSEFGFDRGFDELFEPYFDIGQLPSGRALANALRNPRLIPEFLRRIGKGGSSHIEFKFDLLRRATENRLEAPHLVVCNFTTVHSPYDPPRPYKTRFTPEFSRPRLAVIEHVTGNSGRIDDDDVDLDRVSSMRTPDGIGRFLADPSYLTDAEVALLRRWYAATVRYADDCLGSFLSRYRRRLADDTVLVVTADHGEQLGEHGLWAHSHGLYDETMHVPLLIEGPGIPAGVRRSDPVSLVDLFDTLCDVADLDAPDTTSGRSVFGDRRRDAVFMEYGERDRDEFAGTAHGKYLGSDELDAFVAGRKGVRTGSHRYVRRSDGVERVFDVGDKTIVADPPHELLEGLRSRLRRTLPESYGRWPESPSTESGVDESIRANLEHLGYLE